MSLPSRDDRIREIAGAWYEGARRHLDWSFDRWYHPVIGELLETLVAGGDADEVAVVLGRARAAAGVSLHDALCDFSLLLDALPPRVRRRVAEVELTAALTAGHESWGAVAQPETGFGSVDDLRPRLLCLYRRARRTGPNPASTHAVLLVELDPGPTERPPGAAVVALAEQVRRHFAPVGEITVVGEGRFALLVRQHPGLLVGVAALEDAVTTDVHLTTRRVGIRFETLPATSDRLAMFLEGLCHPSGFDATTPVGEAMIARLGEASWTTAPLRPPPAFLRTFLQVWHGGLSLAAAAGAVVLAAAGLARTLGPFELAPLLPPRTRPAPQVETAAPPPAAPRAQPPAASSAEPLVTSRVTRRAPAPTEKPLTPAPEVSLRPVPIVHRTAPRPPLTGQTSPLSDAGGAAEPEPNRPPGKGDRGKRGDEPKANPEDSPTDERRDDGHRGGGGEGRRGLRRGGNGGGDDDGDGAPRSPRFHGHSHDQKGPSQQLSRHPHSGQR